MIGGSKHYDQVSVNFCLSKKKGIESLSVFLYCVHSVYRGSFVFM